MTVASARGHATRSAPILLRADAVPDVPLPPPRQLPAPAVDPVGHDVCAASLAAEGQLPGNRTASSAQLGWRSVLVKAYTEPAHAEAFTTSATPDLLLVINLRGTFTMECRRAGGWSAALYRPGVIGATAPGGNATLRWRGSGSREPASSLHLHLGSGLLQDTAADLGRTSLATQMPDALLLEDPFVLAAGRALLGAVERQAPPLYGDSLAQALAAHLLCSPRPGADTAGRPVGSGALSGVALQRVIDHMHDHLGTGVDLEELAGVANISKFHFLRLFSQATGSTPHRYLIGLRMERAAELMRTTERTVTQAAAVCGYASPAQFAGTFRRYHGTSPTQFRRDARA